MKIKILVFLLLFLNFLSANPTNKDENYSNSILGGFNYSFFIEHDTTPHINFTIGMLPQTKITDKISILYLISFLRTSALIKNLSDQSFDMNTLNSYKYYYDLEF